MPKRKTKAGGEGPSGKGYSGPLLERNQQVLDFLEKVGPAVPFLAGWAWGPEGARKSSPNHEAEAWGCEAARAAANGEEVAFERAAEVLLTAYFPRELGTGLRGIGLWAGEQLAPDNHSHQHLIGTSMARVAAFLSGRRDLLELSGELLRVTAGALRALATPGQLYISSAGLRAPEGKPPAWWAGTAWLRQVHGLPGPMPEFERNPSNWRSGQGACVRAIRWLQNQGDDLGGAASVGALGCKLKFPVTVYRKDGDRHLVVMPKPREGVPKGEACDWVEVPHGRFGTYAEFLADVYYGHNWTTKPPAPPAGASVIHFPSTWGESPKEPRLANLRGSIGPDGYVPPANVMVTWRRPGAPDISHPLSRGFRWTDDASFRLRYGGGDPETIGRQITAIGSEQLGGRAFLILKELYAQAGLHRIPKEIGQEVWDFAIAEGSGRPMDWCDYKRFTGKPDPICGDKCPPCSGSAGEPVAPGQTVPAPTNLRFDGKALLFDWEGEPPVTFTLYRAAEGHPLAVLMTGKRSPLLLGEVPPAGTRLMLYATQRKKAASAAEIVTVLPVVPPVSPPVEPPPPSPPPPPPPPPAPPAETFAEMLARHDAVAIWDAMTEYKQKEMTRQVLSILIRGLGL